MGYVGVVVPEVEVAVLCSEYGAVGVAADDEYF